MVWVDFSDQKNVLITPFEVIPKRAFLLRMRFLVLGVGVVLFLGVGIFSKWTATSEAQIPSTIWFATLQHYIQLVDTLSHLPRACWWENNRDPFQAQQCRVFWDDLWLRLGVAALPFLGAGILAGFGLQRLKFMYKKAQRKALSGKADAGGVILKIERMKETWFSWVYGFNCFEVSFQVGVHSKAQDQKVMRVYLPASVDTPKESQQIAVFDVSFLGIRKRYLGMPYLPHIAILRS